MQKTDRNTGQRPWGYRRKVVTSTLLFCAITILYCVINAEPDSTVAETAIGGSFGLAGAVIGSYIFGAVWHDRGEKEDV